MHLYSIMNLDLSHINEICEDIKYQYENKITTCPLFCFTLTPEGTPVVDKAKILTEQYIKFKEKLDKISVPSGVLVQASIGHGWKLSEASPFSKYVNLYDGNSPEVVCPYDKDFQKYIYNAFKTIAQANPSCIMVDDDFRLLGRDSGGCCCSAHLKRFNELAGTSFSREELKDILCTNSKESQKYNDIYVQTQKEAILESAKAMRAGIDSVNPSLPGLFCCVGNNAEFAYEVESILSGKDNPIIIRINNGFYTQPTAIYLSDAFFRAASQIAKLKENADIILAETDTCPQNRYSTGANQLHSHFTGTILEGTQGAKQWITRLSAFEPESGMAYRKILSKYSAFYEELAKIVPTLTWHGFRIPVSNKAKYEFGKNWDCSPDFNTSWSSKVFERLGLPMYFSSDKTGVLCLDGDADNILSDEDVILSLSKPIFISSDTAIKLINRGFGKYLGVDIKEYQGNTPTTEIYNGNQMGLQQKLKEIVPLTKDVQVLSSVYHSVDKVNYTELFPAVTYYENELGGKIFVFAGSPNAQYTLTEAFSFLNYTRKQQLIDMIDKTDELLAYYPNDDEVYFRSATTADNELFLSIFNLSFDEIENLELVIKQDVHSIEYLDADGRRKNISFKYENGKYILDLNCYTLKPIILFVR